MPASFALRQAERLATEMLAQHSMNALTRTGM